MSSSVTNFPHFSPPPPPPVKPGPSPPPRPHITPPPPPPSPDNGPTVIVIFFISFGCLFFLAFLAIALFCYIKNKKKKMVQETEIIHGDEHLKVKEGIVQGPHGAEAVVLAVEDDLHVVEEIKKDEKFVEGKHVKSADKISSALEEGTSSSSSGLHQYLEHKPK